MVNYFWTSGVEITMDNNTYQNPEYISWKNPTMVNYFWTSGVKITMDNNNYQNPQKDDNSILKSQQWWIISGQVAWKSQWISDNN